MCLKQEGRYSGLFFSLMLKGGPQSGDWHARKVYAEPQYGVAWLLYYILFVILQDWDRSSVSVLLVYPAGR